MVAPLEFDRAIARGVAPLTLVFIAMLAFNNLCLRYVEVWFYQVARSMTILFSIVFTYTFFGEVTSRMALSACAVVIVGFLMGSAGHGGGEKEKEGEATQQTAFFVKALGIVFGVLSSLFVALYSIFLKRKLPLVVGNEWRLMGYNTLLSVAGLVPLVFVAGEGGVFSEPLLRSPRFWFDMTLTGAFGYLVSLAIFMQVKHTSPLTNTISGTAKACTQTLLAIIIWNNSVSLAGALGIVLVIGGSFWYSIIRYQEMVAKKRMAAAAATTTTTTTATTSKLATPPTLDITVDQQKKETPSS
jgi:GDP-fucose transporter C1